MATNSAAVKERLEIIGDLRAKRDVLLQEMFRLFNHRNIEEGQLKPGMMPKQLEDDEKEKMATYLKKYELNSKSAQKTHFLEKVPVTGWFTDNDLPPSGSTPAEVNISSKPQSPKETTPRQTRSSRRSLSKPNDEATKATAAEVTEPQDDASKMDIDPTPSVFGPGATVGDDVPLSPLTPPRNVTPLPSPSPPQSSKAKASTSTLPQTDVPMQTDGEGEKDAEGDDDEGDTEDHASSVIQANAQRHPQTNGDATITDTSLLHTTPKIGLIPQNNTPGRYEFKPENRALPMNSTPPRPLNHIVSPKKPFYTPPKYVLPSLKTLPNDFQKRPPKTKRKRDRERERTDIKREDFAPIGFNKWGHMIRANPVWKKVARAQKCLNTRDWAVAAVELRLLRTVERIEFMKDKAMWTFRQPKKQRTVGAIPKTHWDRLLEEMKWMRADFREERKWKMAQAAVIAKSVLEWHSIETKEERLRRGIAVLWKRPPKIANVMDDDDMEVEQMVIQSIPDTVKEHETVDLDDLGSDNEVDDVDLGLRGTQEAMETEKDVDAALEGLEERQQQQAAILKMEETEDASNWSNEAEKTQPAVEAVSLTIEAPSVHQTKNDGTSLSSNGLKPTSTDPVLGSGAADTNAPSEILKPVPVFSTLRRDIAYSNLDKLYIQQSDLNMPQGEDDSSLENLSSPDDLATVFPELQIFDTTETTAPSTSSKRPEKMMRRVDETIATKIVNGSIFNTQRPMLISALKPSEHWRHGHWEFDDFLTADEVASAKKNDETFKFNSLWDCKPPQMMGHDPHPYNSTPDFFWSPGDDTAIRQLAEHYIGNWPLIADAFNSSRVLIKTDRRTPTDCFRRWKYLSPQLTRDARAPLEAHSTAATPANSFMTTRGTKRTVNAPNGPAPSLVPPATTKARKRHVVMTEIVRKFAKKRDANAKAQAMKERKPAASHETHAVYEAMPVLTPHELSRAKSERDMAAIQKREAERRAAIEASNRQQQHPLQPGGVRFPGQGAPITRQVNISQQQRMPAVQAGAGIHRPPSQQAQQQPVPNAQQQQMYAQMQAAQRAAVANGAGGPPNAHMLAPPFNNRAQSSSPALAPSPTPNGIPRPPSAQANGMLAATQQNYQNIGAAAYSAQQAAQAEHAMRLAQQSAAAVTNHYQQM